MSDANRTVDGPDKNQCPDCLRVIEETGGISTRCLEHERVHRELTKLREEYEALDD